MRTFAAIAMAAVAAAYHRSYSSHSHADLEKEVTDAEAQIATVTAAVEALAKKCVADTDEVAELTGEVNALKEWTTPLEATSGDIDLDVGDIEALNPTVTNQVDTLASDLLEERKKIAVLE